jgi:hypothetical protein
MKADAFSPVHRIAETASVVNPCGNSLEVRGSVAHRTQQNVEATSLGGDVLYGAKEIARFLFGSEKGRRKVYNLVGSKSLPHFRLGANICSRKSVLLDWIARQEVTATITEVFETI